MAKKFSDNYQKTAPDRPGNPKHSLPSDDLTLSSRKIPDMPEALADELIRSLTDATENRRARQVFEWEKIRRNSLSRAA